MRQILKTTWFWALLAIVGCACFGFAAMFDRVRGVFGDQLEDMSHGWLILPFSLYVLWTERKELVASVGAPSSAGLVACIPCALLALLGTRGLQLRFEQLGFIGLCVAVPWTFGGWRFARLFVFPALFLLFTIPLSTFLDVVTVHLRLLASGTALAVLRGCGVDVVQQGTAVISQGAHPFSIDVAEPCSGLRSIFALMALTAAYAWYTQPTWTRRMVLFACSVPLAVLGNVTRILTICFVAAWASADFALGFYHDYSGYVVFVVAIALMVACGEFITRVAESLGRARGRPAAVPAEPPPRRASTVFDHLLPLVAALALCPIFVFQGLTPNTTVAEPPVFALPVEMKGYWSDALRFCQNDQCGKSFLLSDLEKERARADVCPACGGALEEGSLGERTVLPKDTVIHKRLYRASHAQFLVSAVIGGTSKSSLHRPELCMPAQGFLMRAPTDFAVAGRPFHAIRLESPHGPPTVLSYTFFNQAGVWTSSHVRRILRDVWDRSVFNRIDRWVMITVSASCESGFSLDSPAHRAELEEFLARLSKELP